MVQDVEMVRNLNPGRQEFTDGSHEALFIEITFWIVISPHHQDSSMMPRAHHEEVVQIFEIMVIVRQKSPILADSLGQMHRVIIAGHANFGRNSHVVAGLPQQARQQGRGAIVIQIEPHSRQSRDIS